MEESHNYGPFVHNDGTDNPDLYQALWRCMPCDREYRTEIGVWSRLECDECQKTCIRAPNELKLGQQIAATQDDEDMQRFIDNSDSSTTLTMEVLDDTPLRSDSVPAPGTPAGRKSAPVQPPKKRADTQGASSEPKKRQEKGPEGKPKKTIPSGQRQRSPEPRQPARQAQQPPLQTNASKRSSKIKPRGTHVSVTPDDEKSPSRSSSSTSSSTKSTSNSTSSHNNRGTRHQIDAGDF